jgi:hypothetical protein
VRQDIQCRLRVLSEAWAVQMPLGSEPWLSRLGLFPSAGLSVILPQAEWQYRVGWSWAAPLTPRLLDFLEEGQMVMTFDGRCCRTPFHPIFL